MDLKKGILILTAIALLANVGIATLNVSLSDQGTNVRNKTSGSLVSTDLTVEIWDNLTSGTNIYNETFSSAIVNGNWNVMLGEDPANPLSLDFNKKYYKNYYIGGEDADFTNLTGSTVERQFFYSPLGEVGDEDISSIGNLTANYFIGNGSLLTDIIADMNWSDPVDANIIPDTNALRDLGNSTHRFNASFFSDDMTLKTWRTAPSIGNIANSSKFILTGKYNDGVAREHSFTIYDNVYSIATPYGRLAYESYSGAVFYIEPWATSTVLYGGDTTGDRIWLKGSTVDSYPQIGALGGGDIYLLVDNGNGVIVRQNGSVYLDLARNGTTYTTNSTIGLGWEFDVDTITTGDGVLISSDGLTTGNAFRIEDNGVNLFKVNTTGAHIFGDLLVNGTFTSTFFENGHLIPLTNNTYDLGNTTNMYRDAYIAGKLTVYGDIDPKNIEMTGNLSYTGTNPFYIFGGDTSGDDMYLYANSVDAEPRIEILGNEDVIVYVPTTQALEVDTNGYTAWKLSDSTSYSQSKTTTGLAFQVIAPNITTGNALTIKVDNDTVTTGNALEILSGPSYSSSIFNIDEDGDTEIRTFETAGAGAYYSSPYLSLTGKQNPFVEIEPAITLRNKITGTLATDIMLEIGRTQTSPGQMFIQPSNGTIVTTIYGGSTGADGGIILRNDLANTYPRLNIENPNINLNIPTTGVIDFYIEGIGSVLNVDGDDGSALFRPNVSTTDGVEILADELTSADALEVIANGSIMTTGRLLSLETLIGDVFYVDASDVYVTGDLNVTGTLTANSFENGDLIPATNNTYDLGNSTNMWKDAYVAGKLTVYGNIDPINISMTGNLHLSDNKNIYLDTAGTKGFRYNTTWNAMEVVGGVNFNLQTLSELGWNNSDAGINWDGSALELWTRNYTTQPVRMWAIAEFQRGAFLRDNQSLYFDTARTKSLYYNTTDNRFEFNDDVLINGDLNVTGNIDPINISLTGSLNMENDSCIYLDSEHTKCFKWDSGNSRFGLNDSLYIGDSPSKNVLIDPNASPAIIKTIADISTGTKVTLVEGYGTNNIGYRLSKARGTQASPNAVQSDDVLGFYGGGGYTGTTFPSQNTGTMRIRAAENFTDAAQGTYISFETTEAGTTGRVERVRVTDDGGFRVGNSTDNLLISPNGEINLTGTARKTKTLQLLPNYFSSPTADGAQAWRQYHTPTYRFDDSIDERIVVTLSIPADMDLSDNPVCRLYVAPYAAQTVGSDFVFYIDAKYIANGEGIDKANDESGLSTTFTVSNTASIVTTTDITLNSSLMATGDLVALELWRDANSGSDDRNGDASFIAMDFRYTANKIGA